MASRKPLICCLHMHKIALGELSRFTVHRLVQRHGLSKASAGGSEPVEPAI